MCEFMSGVISCSEIAGNKSVMIVFVLYKDTYSVESERWDGYRGPYIK
jgi:hypothetical protein